MDRRNRLLSLLKVCCFIFVFLLAGCGSEQGFSKIDTDIFRYGDQIYRGNGKILLSEKELEYVSLIEEFPEGVEGAEKYINLYEYSKWLLLGSSEGEYIFLTPHNKAMTESGEIKNTKVELADGVPDAYIFYNDSLYIYSDDKTAEELGDDMEELGFIEGYSIRLRTPDVNFHCSRPRLAGHMLFKDGDTLAVSRDGGKIYNIYCLDRTQELRDREDRMMKQYEMEIDMSSANSNTGLDYRNRYIMTGKEVEVRDRPRQSGYVLRTLSYQMVNVGTATYSNEGIWVLVSFFCFDSSQDNMGWVKLTDLMEYTEENYQLLRYPVKVKEGSVDLETGESVEWDAFSVDYVDNYAIVTREGGRSYKVSPSDIIYPESVNNEDEIQKSAKTEIEIDMSDIGADMSSMSGKESEDDIIHMANAMDEIGLDYKNKYIMTGKDVDVLDRPRRSGYVLRTLSYEVVDVGMATYDFEGNIWVIVSFFCFDSASNNMGWVKLTDLMEYTEENYQLLRYPVRVKEGSVDLETGEPIIWSNFAVDYIDDYAVVTREGGRWHNVSPSDIIYPEFNNNSPYNFPTFSDY